MASTTSGGWPPRQISSSRAYTDAIRARLHVLPKWADRPLSSIRPSDVDDWIAELSRRTGPHSVRHCYTVFRGPLRRAIKDRLIDDPCIDVPLPKEPDLRTTFDHVLSASEVDQLVEAIHDRTPGDESLKTNDLRPRRGGGARTARPVLAHLAVCAQRPLLGTRQVAGPP